MVDVPAISVQCDTAETTPAAADCDTVCSAAISSELIGIEYRIISLTPAQVS